MKRQVGAATPQNGSPVVDDKCAVAVSVAATSRKVGHRVPGMATRARKQQQPMRTGDAFRLALETLPTGIVLVDSSGVIVFVNPEFQWTFGYASVELIGQRAEMLAPRRLRARHRHYRIGFFKRRNTRRVSRRRASFGLRRDGTEFSVEISLRGLTIAGDRFLLGSIVDISEQQRSIQRLHRQISELRASFEHRGVEGLQRD